MIFHNRLTTFNFDNKISQIIFTFRIIYPIKLILRKRWHLPFSFDRKFPILLYSILSYHWVQKGSTFFARRSFARCFRLLKLKHRMRFRGLSAIPLLPAWGLSRPDLSIPPYSMSINFFQLGVTTCYHAVVSI